ncbi:hypothetical protein DNTS_012103 [Danionella cerebrum]|uniref:Uncharacterized protein n=1 Tax=Danionella cerebrum TaxID=2873325 RepID=A0A553QKH2_9TELE|nr:hypothetical protein DNTS_012103 [Danionella translucida]
MQESCAALFRAASCSALGLVLKYSTSLQPGNSIFCESMEKGDIPGEHRVWRPLRPLVPGTRKRSSVKEKEKRRRRTGAMMEFKALTHDALPTNAPILLDPAADIQCAGEVSELMTDSGPEKWLDFTIEAELGMTASVRSAAGTLFSWRNEKTAMEQEHGAMKVLISRSEKRSAQQSAITSKHSHDENVQRARQLIHKSNKSTQGFLVQVAIEQQNHLALSKVGISTEKSATDHQQYCREGFRKTHTKKVVGGCGSEPTEAYARSSGDRKKALGIVICLYLRMRFSPEGNLAICCHVSGLMRMPSAQPQHLVKVLIVSKVTNTKSQSITSIRQKKLIQLSIHSPIGPSIHLPVHPYIHSSFCPLLHLSIHLSTYSSTHLSIHPSVRPSIHLPVHPSIHCPNHLPAYPYHPSADARNTKMTQQVTEKSEEKNPEVREETELFEDSNQVETRAGERDDGEIQYDSSEYSIYTLEEDGKMNDTGSGIIRHALSQSDLRLWPTSSSVFQYVYNGLQFLAEPAENRLCRGPLAWLTSNASITKNAPEYDYFSKETGQSYRNEEKKIIIKERMRRQSILPCSSHTGVIMERALRKADGMEEFQGWDELTLEENESTGDYPDMSGECLVYITRHEMFPFFHPNSSLGTSTVTTGSAARVVVNALMTQASSSSRLWNLAQTAKKIHSVLLMVQLISGAWTILNLQQPLSNTSTLTAKVQPVPLEPRVPALPGNTILHTPSSYLQPGNFSFSLTLFSSLFQFIFVFIKNLGCAHRLLRGVRCAGVTPRHEHFPVVSTNQQDMPSDGEPVLLTSQLAKLVSLSSTHHLHSNGWNTAGTPVESCSGGMSTYSPVSLLWESRKKPCTHFYGFSSDVTATLILPEVGNKEEEERILHESVCRGEGRNRWQMDGVVAKVKVWMLGSELFRMKKNGFFQCGGRVGILQHLRAADPGSVHGEGSIHHMLRLRDFSRLQQGTAKHYLYKEGSGKKKTTSRSRGVILQEEEEEEAIFLLRRLRLRSPNRCEGSPLATASVSWVLGCSGMLPPGEVMKVESLGGVALGLRSGEVRTGIQQASEWPYSSHSRVHFPVIATSGKGRESGNREKEGLSLRLGFKQLEKYEH